MHTSNVAQALPRTLGSWVTYGLCGFVFVSGVSAYAFGGLMPYFLVGVPLVGLTFLVQLVNLPSRLRTARWRSGLPLLACVLVFPCASVVGGRMLIARFFWHRAQYESIAEGIRSGKHPESLDPSERALARWVKAMRTSDLGDTPWALRRLDTTPSDSTRRLAATAIMGVHFLVLTHGFGGHAGFMRTFEPEAARYLDKGHGADGWFYSKKLTDNWYLVAD